MLIREAQKWGARILKKSGVDSPELDTDVLLAEALKKSKEWLFANPEAPLKKSAEKKFRDFIKRRAKREPVAYILGRKEFYELDFHVARRVLIPRPETELLIDEALAAATKASKAPIIVDVGAGSGAIAITLSKHLPKARVFATDISPAALSLARANARRHGVSSRIKFLKGNLLIPFLKITKSKSYNFQDSSFKIIVANLPYLPTREWQKTQPEIKKYEPRIALDGGPNGLKYIRELLEQIKKAQLHKYVIASPASAGRSNLVEIATAPLDKLGAPRNDNIAILEFDPEQTKKLSSLIRAHFPRAKFEIKKDLARKNRVMIISF